MWRCRCGDDAGRKSLPLLEGSGDTQSGEVKPKRYRDGRNAGCIGTMGWGLGISPDGPELPNVLGRRYCCPHVCSSVQWQRRTSSPNRPGRKLRSVCWPSALPAARSMRANTRPARTSSAATSVDNVTQWLCRPEATNAVRTRNPTAVCGGRCRRHASMQASRDAPCRIRRGAATARGRAHRSWFRSPADRQRKRGRGAATSGWVRWLRRSGAP